MFGAFIWMFSPAWDAVKLILMVGIICPFVVIEPSDLGVCYNRLQNTGHDCMFGAFIWLFSPAWNAVKLILIVGFICPFVVIEPSDLGVCDNRGCPV